MSVRLTLEVIAPETIHQAASDAVRVCRAVGVDVAFTFNDTKLVVAVGDNFDDVVYRYFRERGEAPK